MLGYNFKWDGHGRLSTEDVSFEQRLEVKEEKSHMAVTKRACKEEEIRQRHRGTGQQQVFQKQQRGQCG